MAEIGRRRTTDIGRNNTTDIVRNSTTEIGQNSMTEIDETRIETLEYGDDGSRNNTCCGGNQNTTERVIRSQNVRHAIIRASQKT